MEERYSVRKTGRILLHRFFVYCLVCLLAAAPLVSAGTHYINTDSTSNDIRIGNAKQVYLNNSNGYVGFGVLSPDERVELAGSLIIADSSGSDPPEIKFLDDGSSLMGAFGGYYSSGNFFVMQSDSSTDTIVIYDRKVGIGLPSDTRPSSPLTIYSGATHMRLNYSGAYSSDIDLDSSGYLTLDPNQDIINLGFQGGGTDVIIDDGGLVVSRSGITPSVPDDGDFLVEGGSMCIGSGGCSPESTDGTLEVATASQLQSYFYAAGIGGTSSTTGYYSLYIYASGDDEFKGYTSSERYKEDITPLDIDTGSVLGLRPVEFVFKETGEWDFGLIAEETVPLVPDLAFRNESGDIDGVEYVMVPLFLIEVLEEQRNRLEKNRLRLAGQRERLRMQESEIRALEKDIEAVLDDYGNKGHVES